VNISFLAEKLPYSQICGTSYKNGVIAIEITTNAQEATAKHQANQIEQEAKGKLERLRIKNDAAAEKARQELLKLQTQSAALESTGQAKAEAKSRAEAAKIEGEANVENAELRAKAEKIESEAELSRLTLARNAEIDYLEKKNEIVLKKQKESTAIEINKFQKMVNAMGKLVEYISGRVIFSLYFQDRKRSKRWQALVRITRSSY